jgi:hypothetical protein
MSIARRMLPPRVVVHPAFMNTPTMLVGPPDAGILTAIAFGVILAVLWPHLERFTGRIRSQEVDDARQRTSN